MLEIVNPQTAGVCADHADEEGELSGVVAKEGVHVSGGGLVGGGGSECTTFVIMDV